MTFRTFDIDNGLNAEDASAPVRRIRSRRRSLALTSRTGGARISGFGL